MASSTNKISISWELVGSSLFGYIKGKRSSIESETGAKLIFPSSTNKYSLIVEGTSDSVGSVQRHIDEVVNMSHFPHSHFISLPLAKHSQLVDKITNFQNSALLLNDPNHGDRKIDKSIFINPHRLHLTLLTLKLWNMEMINAAVEIFKGIKAEVMDALGGQPVSVKLKGLDCMEDSSEEAHVLYLPVEVVGGEDRLLRACKIITDAFTKGGLVLNGDTNRTLKLHVTVMNTIQRPRKYADEKAAPFNAKGVMGKYESEKWGEYAIPEIHLSQRFKYDDKGYYHCCAFIPLNHRNMQAD